VNLRFREGNPYLQTEDYQELKKPFLYLTLHTPSPYNSRLYFIGVVESSISRGEPAAANIGLLGFQKKYNYTLHTPSTAPEGNPLLQTEGYQVIYKSFNIYYLHTPSPSREGNPYLPTEDYQELKKLFYTKLYTPLTPITPVYILLESVNLRFQEGNMSLQT
jgi:hypothetical protein